MSGKTTDQGDSGVLPVGRVIQSIGGFQNVLLEEGKIVTCKARGRIKRRQGEIVAGDLVSLAIGPEGTVVEAVEPRRNLLRRPLVANVDQAVLVFALRDPEPNLLLVDRFLVALRAMELPVLLCLNKLDLAGPKESRELAEYYRRLGFAIVLTSALTHEGRRNLLRHLYGRFSVFCGPSGVGKSALINMLRPGTALPTGEISSKLKRGRHTTRAVQLIPLGRSGFVADTPGFTQVELAGLARADLLRGFPEIDGLGGRCRYRGCVHLAEPGCAVKEAVERGSIPAARYRHYCRFVAEIAVEKPRG